MLSTRLLASLFFLAALGVFATAPCHAAPTNTVDAIIAPSAPAETPGPVTLKGLITQNGSPAPDATITLRSARNIVANGTTGADGRFVLFGLDRASFTLVASRGGVTATKVITYKGAPLSVTLDLPKPKQPTWLHSLLRSDFSATGAAPIFIVSDRSESDGTFDPLDRAHPDKVSYAMVTASPQPGSIEQPQPADAAAFLTTMAKTAEQQHRTNDLLVVVPGFNNDVNDGIRSAQRLASRFPGVVVLFSWPSKHGKWIPEALFHDPSSYFNDEVDNAWASSDFCSLLLDLLFTPGPNGRRWNISLFAHSMGNRLVADGFVVLQKTQEPPLPGGSFNQVIMAAADVDTDIFTQQALPAITAIAKRLTFYRSNHDGALAMSAFIHGHSRAGRNNTDFSVATAAPNFEIIDTSALSCPGPDHGYWSDSATVFYDILAALAGNAVTATNRSSYLVAAPEPNVTVFDVHPVHHGDDGGCTY